MRLASLKWLWFILSGRVYPIPVSFLSSLFSARSLHLALSNISPFTSLMINIFLGDLTPSRVVLLDANSEIYLWIGERISGTTSYYANIWVEVSLSPISLLFPLLFPLARQFTNFQNRNTFAKHVKREKARISNMNSWNPAKNHLSSSVISMRGSDLKQ